MTLPTLSPNPKPNYQDRLRIMQTVGVALDKSLRLSDYDSTGAEAVRSLLGGIAAHAADERHWAHLRHLQP